MIKQKKYFLRLRRILKIIGWKPAIATISAFVILYFLKIIYNFCLSNEWSWISAVVSLGTLGGLYNNYCQIENEDAKNALLKDWRDLPILIHLLIIFSAIVSLLIVVYRKYILDILNNRDNIKNIKYIAYGK